MDALDEAKIRYSSEVHAGYHHWPYWQRDLHRVFPKVLQAI
jgi:S-formylglutathione hydrolase FrmB